MFSSSKPQLLGVRGQEGVLGDIHDSGVFLVHPGSRRAEECMQRKPNHPPRLVLLLDSCVCKLVWARWSDKSKPMEVAAGRRTTDSKAILPGFRS